MPSGASARMEDEAKVRSPLYQVGVLPAATAHRARRGAGGELACGRVQGQSRAGPHTVGRHVQPRARRCHRLRPSRRVFSCSSTRPSLVPTRRLPRQRPPEAGWCGGGPAHPRDSGRAYRNIPDPDLEDWVRAYCVANFQLLDASGQGAIRATSSASGTRFRVAPWGVVYRTREGPRGAAD